MVGVSESSIDDARMRDAKDKLLDTDARQKVVFG
jgi:hypothetical protein